MKMYQKRGVKGFAGRLIVRYFAGLAYIAGLTALIPLIAVQAETSPTYFSVALGLIIVSIILIFMQKRSIALTLRYLGKTTIIPGAIALIILIFGREAFLAVIVKYSSVVEPVLRSYIENSVPKAWIISIAYLLIGFILWIIGARMTERRLRHLVHEIKHIK